MVANAHVPQAVDLSVLSTQYSTQFSVLSLGWISHLRLSQVFLIIAAPHLEACKLTALTLALTDYKFNQEFNAQIFKSR